ncbi:MAG TPA: dihydrofolate reductase family protein [Actinospica sp.]|jgi:dihydrofolate reductase|nr:dihydrofolate reductase family protein [Actinospica sp.]
MSVIAISFVTLDGTATDPDGSAGTPYGGWMFRYGRAAIDGDKFQLGPIMAAGGVLLFGRGTWQHFAKLWPAREGVFADHMNATPKLVASRAAFDTAAWQNSTVVEGDLIDAVKNEQRDVIVMGSLSLVRQLAAADLVDEYRLMTFPTIVAAGDPFFAAVPPAEFDCVSAELTGPLVLTRYRRGAR